MIKSYFNELEKNYTVDFADEEVFMGTGGGLCLLKGKIDTPFFFTNCDTLLDVDFGDIYEYHKSHRNLVTMICAFKHYTVPYGVVELGENGSIAAMREKPELDFLTNTGVYVVEPRVVEEMRDGEKIGFPDVIERYRRAGEKVGVYPISESSWMDMGQIEELDAMRRRTRAMEPFDTRRALQDYRLVILGTPIWAGRCSSIARGFLKRRGLEVQNIAYVVVHGSEELYKDVCDQMDQYVDHPHVADVSLRIGSTGYHFWRDEFIRNVTNYMTAEN